MTSFSASPSFFAQADGLVSRYPQRRRNERFWDFVAMGERIWFHALLSPDGTIVEAAGDRVASLGGRILWETDLWSHSPAARSDLRSALRDALAGVPTRVSTTMHDPERSVVTVDVTAAKVSADRVSITVFEPQESASVAEALSQSHRLVSTLMANLPGMVYRCLNDADWSLVFASDGCLQLTGYPPSALVAKEVNFADLIHPEDVAAVWEEVQAGVQTREPYKLEYRIVDRAGSTKWVWEQGQGIFDDEDRLVCLEGFITDITSLRKAQEQVRRLQRLETVGRVAGAVAHDFNNLLSALTGWGELLEAAARDQPTLAEPANEILALCASGAALAGQLLTFARGQIVQKRRVDIAALVTTLMSTLRRVIRENIEIRADVGDGPAYVEIDPGQAEQLIYNLCINARDAMPEGGELSVTVRRIDDDGGAPAVELCVTDTGVGIDSELRERVFEPFFSTKPDGKGTGLGLAIVAEVVASAGGSVELDSESGRGSRFTLRLPACTRDGESVANESDDDAFPRVRVVLVEDDDNVRAVVARLLEGNGVEVTATASGAEAIAAVEAGERFDVLMTDIVMPRMGGLDLADRIQSLVPGLKVIFTSGYAPDGRVQERVSARRAAFLAKPFGIADLRDTLREVCKA